MPAGPDLFGWAIGGAVRYVGWNARIAEGSPLWAYVLSHETAHLLLGGASVALCRPGSCLARAERTAAHGAAILAVPRSALDEIAADPWLIPELAAHLDVPVPLAVMRYGLALRDGELPDSARVGRMLVRLAERTLDAWLDRAAVTLAAVGDAAVPRRARRGAALAGAAAGRVA